MVNSGLPSRILSHLQSKGYRPERPQKLADALRLQGEGEYPSFRQALKELMREGRAVLGAGGTVMLPTQQVSRDIILGTYRHNRRGFGFVVPTDPQSHEDLFIPEGENGGALTGDAVRAKITSRGQRDGKTMYTGRVTDIVQRSKAKFVGALVKQGTRWVVMPDGNTFTNPIIIPDAGSKHVKAGTKVVVELTTYPEGMTLAQGVITEVLGQEGEKDVDLRGIIAQFGFPEEFPEETLAQARIAVDTCDMERERSVREDLSGQTILTIDPDDSKDFDDAISLRRMEDNTWELGVHIADVAHFIPAGSALDVEAHERGNSVYFPGYVIPMLPEILSNGICSLQEGVPRLCKSAFIILDDHGRPVRMRFANTIIQSALRMRYKEAQAIIDKAAKIPHPDGPRKLSYYPREVVDLLQDMNHVSRLIQKRRLAAGQLVLNLPTIDLVLDDGGRVVDAVPEDQSFTHTLIEMFMVEANEALARLLEKLDVPFLRRIHPDPEDTDSLKLREFIMFAGYKLPKTLDRKALQGLLAAVKGKPCELSINLAVLKSLTRAEYSPQAVGHYALASEQYCHFTSPIRRYADLTVHRLLDEYLRQGAQSRRSKVKFEGTPTEADLIELGKHLSVTERRAEGAERELRQIKVLTLLQGHVGEVFDGVVSGIANFGLFIQLRTWLIDGLIRYEHLLDDWWDVNEKAGYVQAQRSGVRIGIGEVVKVVIVNVDLPRRELNLAVVELPGGKQLPAKGQTDKGRPQGGRPQKAQTDTRKNLRPPMPPHGRPQRQAAGQPPRGGGRSHHKGKGKRP